MFCEKENKFSFVHGLSKQDENQEVITQKPREEGFPRRKEWSPVTMLTRSQIKKIN